MRCRMHARYCVCEEVERLDLRTRIVVLMHYREWGKTTATAHLASLALSNFAIYLRGKVGQPLPTKDLRDPERRQLLLYPAEDARVLTRELVAEDPRPVTIVVPDGSWRQASKVLTRVEALHDVERIVLPPGPPSEYKLRRETKEAGLATYEAIARTLGIIEGMEVQKSLERPFHAMVERTLLTRRGL